MRQPALVVSAYPSWEGIYADLPLPRAMLYGSCLLCRATKAQRTKVLAMGIIFLLVGSHLQTLQSDLRSAARPWIHRPSGGASAAGGTPASHDVPVAAPSLADLEALAHALEPVNLERPSKWTCSEECLQEIHALDALQETLVSVWHMDVHSPLGPWFAHASLNEYAEVSSAASCPVALSSFWLATTPSRPQGQMRFGHKAGRGVECGFMSCSSSEFLLATTPWRPQGQMRFGHEAGLI